MTPAEDELAEVERTYRKLRFTLLLHLGFFLACCGVAFVARRGMGLPPAMLGLVIIVALLVFGGDIWKFLTCRERLRRLRAELDSS